MFIKLVLALAVSSFISHNALAYQNQRLQNIVKTDDDSLGESFTDQGSHNHSKPSWLIDKDLGLELIEANYEQWVQQIRSSYPSLLHQIDIYERAIENNYQQPRLLADYVTLLGWSGRYIQAVNFYKSELKNYQLPSYALNIVALSAREIQNYPLSRKLYQQALSQTPTYLNAQLGLAALEIREGQWDVAEASIKNILSSQPANQEALSLLAYLYNQQQVRTIEKVSTYDKILALDSNDPEIIRLRTLNLLELGLVEPAQQAMQDHVEIYKDEDWLRLYSVKNTKSARRIARDPRAQRNSDLISKALTDNALYIKQLGNNSGTDKELLATAYADHLLILNKAGQHDAVTVYADGWQDYLKLMPDYGIVAVVDSLQAQNKSLQAFELIDSAFERQQTKLDDNEALKAGYYAALDSGHIESGESYLLQLEDNNPQWIHSPDKLRRTSNPDYPAIRLMQAMHFAYTNQLDEAQARLEELLRTAPGNNEYRKNYADVLRWRGFIDASNYQLEIIKATDSNYQPASISGIYNDMAHRQFAVSRQAIDSLNDPETLPVIRLKEDYDIATSAQLYFSTTLANSSGSSFSSKDRSYNFSAYSDLLNDHWRLFAESDTNHSRFFGEKESVASFGLGVQYHNKFHLSEVELYQIEELNALELAVNSTLYFDDQFSLNLEHQTYHKQIPVRALYSNVSADLNSVLLSYRYSEKQSYSLGWLDSHFSDSNHRQALLLSGTQTVLHDFRQRLTLSEFLYAENNSADTNRLYFNPDSVKSISLNVSYSRLLYKHAPTDLWHGLIFQLGSYQQKGFSSAATWGILYEHQWQINKRSFLHYSLGYSEQVYDGLAENGPIFNLTYGVAL